MSNVTITVIKKNAEELSKCTKVLKTPQSNLQCLAVFIVPPCSAAAMQLLNRAIIK